MKDPLKQGLKPETFCGIAKGIQVEVKDPLKQGLKHTKIVYNNNIRY